MTQGNSFPTALGLSVASVLLPVCPLSPVVVEITKRLSLGRHYFASWNRCCVLRDAALTGSLNTFEPAGMCRTLEADELQETASIKCRVKSCCILEQTSLIVCGPQVTHEYIFMPINNPMSTVTWKFGRLFG